MSKDEESLTVAVSVLVDDLDHRLQNAWSRAYMDATFSTEPLSGPTPVHWVAKLPASTTSLLKGASNTGVLDQGLNGFGVRGWTGACPEPGEQSTSRSSSCG